MSCASRCKGCWADDSNGPYWYVLENKRTLALNLSYRVTLDHIGFERLSRFGRPYYWRVRGVEGLWLFKRVMEEIADVFTMPPFCSGVRRCEKRVGR